VETFEGRGAVITGGASGIGFATAAEFTRRGARVVLADIDQTALDAAVEQLRAGGAEAHGVLCDVTKLDAVEHLADESFSLLGGVNLVEIDLLRAGPHTTAVPLPELALLNRVPVDGALPDGVIAKRVVADQR